MSLFQTERLELKIPPPALVLIAALLMWLVSRAVPSLSLPAFPRAVVAVVLAGIGAGIAVAGVESFRRAKTTVNPTRPGAASWLVCTGVYRFTRNPMYLGLVIILLAWGVSLSNPVSLLVVALFILYMNRFQIAPEERALSALFGAEFLAYKKRVRRWI